MRKKISYSTFILLFLLTCITGCKNQQIAAGNEDEIVPESVYFYGINIDSLDVVQEEIQRNSFLSEILLSHDVDYSTIHQITESSAGIFDFRKLKTGQSYYVLQSKDSLKTPEFFIYEKSLSEYIVCDFRNSICVYEGQKPVRTITKEASGVIESSLYLTLENNNLHPTLALKLANIYAWTIDFYHLQKGDKFKVIYEEKFVENTSLGITNIKAAVFNHYGKDIYATPYAIKGDSVSSYYDHEGASLQRTFLKSPLKFGRKTSGYSSNRKHPVTGVNKAHKGTDYAAPAGTPILSTADGVIEAAAFTKYNGNYVKVKHNSTYMTQYLHMSKFASGIKPGKHVRQGDVIGYVGSTGLATGPHVCYRFWKYGSQIDHTRDDLPPSDPIPDNELSTYLAYFDSVRVQLDKVIYPEKVVETPNETADGE